MAEGGYDCDDENRPLLDDQDDKNDDEDDDIQMQEFIRQSDRAAVNEGEEAETSFGGTGLSATKTKLCDSVVYYFYKQQGYEPFLSDYNNCEYENTLFYKGRIKNQTK